jgi:rhamnogalacturonyl hydrolase YesR
LEKVADTGQQRDSSGLLYNYLGNTSSLAETSGTSLLAATVYRMAVLEPSTFGAPYINWANASLKAIAKHVGSNGIVSPAVDPYGYTSTTPYTTGSPEGQAFAVMLYAAYRDCVGVGVCS